MKKIVKLSRLLKWVAIIIGVALPLVEVGYWMTGGYGFLEPLFSFSDLPQFDRDVPTTWESLSGMQRFLGFLITLIPLAFSIAALAYLAQLFRAFQRLELFERKNVQSVKRVGWMLIGGQLVYPLYLGLLSLALTYNNPDGHRVLHVAFGSTQLEVVAIGLAVILISWILEQAAQIHEEQVATI